MAKPLTMRQTTRRAKMHPSIFVLVVLLATVLLRVSPVTPSPASKGIFGRRSRSDSEQEETPRKSSWQFFYQKTESNEAAESEITTEEGSNEKEDTKKSGFRFGFRRKRENEETSNKVEDETEDNDNPEDEEAKSDVETDDETESSEDASAEKQDSESSDEDSETNEDEASPEGTTDEDETETKNDESPKTESPDPMQQYMEQYQAQQRLHRQRLMSPGAIIYRSPSPYQQQHQIQRLGGPQDGMPSMTPNQAMAAAAIVNLLALASRIFFVKWLIDRLAFESEAKAPIQHFMWECLNDKFVKDNEIWNRVLSRVPETMGLSQRKWDKTVRAMGPQPEKKKTPKISRTKKNRRNSKTKDKIEELQQDQLTNNDTNMTSSTVIESTETTQTVVVMDFSTMSNPNPDFLRFADVVTFLVGSNSPRKQMFGQKPEVVLLLQSPGGEVTSFAFAAAQVARLRNAGWNVTVCVDRIAASGGYMIASQATQILASPFAMVGSVGVITESLNFYEILKKHGIQSLVLKAGDNKNPITQFGKVSDEDIKTTQKDLDETHRSFIELCRSRRPTLDPAVCNGRVLSGTMALEKGMIDRILTSDEYILEKIAQGDLVMKLHLVSGNSERHMIANALQILPHLSSKVQQFLSSENPGWFGKLHSWVGKLNMNGSLTSKAIQFVGLATMIRRALARSSEYASAPTGLQRSKSYFY